MLGTSVSGARNAEHAYSRECGSQQVCADLQVKRESQQSGPPILSLSTKYPKLLLCELGCDTASNQKQRVAHVCGQHTLAAAQGEHAMRALVLACPAARTPTLSNGAC